SISIPKNGSFPAANTQSGYKNLLIEQVTSDTPVAVTEDAVANHNFVS
ncbi:20073_t:CDS:2, partial [Gigaspora rosea]